MPKNLARVSIYQDWMIHQSMAVSDRGEGRSNNLPDEIPNHRSIKYHIANYKSGVLDILLQLDTIQSLIIYPP